MQDEELYRRVSDLADPGRCQANTAKGQCQFYARPESPFCILHAGGGNKADVKEKVRNYRLTKYQARMQEFADNDQVKSLREELGILRILFEEVVNKCQDANDLILSSGHIGDLALKIEKLVKSCHQLESATGMLMDKTAIIQLADMIVVIIHRYIKDPDVIDTISNEIISTILSKTVEAKVED